MTRRKALVAALATQDYIDIQQLYARGGSVRRQGMVGGVHARRPGADRGVSQGARA